MAAFRNPILLVGLAAVLFAAATTRAQSEADLYQLILQSGRDGMTSFALSQADRYLQLYPQGPNAASVALIRCQFLGQLNQTQNQQQCLLAYLEAFPSSPPANPLRLQLALQLADAGDRKLARQLLGDLLSAAPDREQACFARYTLGLWAYDAQDWPTAAKWFTELLDDSPCSERESAARIGLAQALEAQNLFCDAAAIWSVILEPEHALEPETNLTAAVSRARDLFQCQDYPNAVLAARDALRIVGSGADAGVLRYILGISLWSLGQKEEAIGELAPLLDAPAVDAAVREEISELTIQALIDLGRTEEAGGKIDAFLVQFPSSAAAARFRAFRWTFRAQDDELVTRLRAMWATHGTQDEGSCSEMMSLMNQEGMFPQLLGLARLCPGQIRAGQAGLAVIPALEAAGDWEAVAVWLKTLATNAPAPDQILLLQRLAQANLQAGDAVSAAALVQQLLMGADDLRDKPAALYTLGRAQLLLGSPDAALAVFREIAALLPPAPSAVQRAAASDSAGILLNRGKWEEAADLLRFSLEGEQDPLVRAAGLSLLGDAYLRGGKAVEARAAWQEGLSLSIPAEISAHLTRKLSQIVAMEGN